MRTHPQLLLWFSLGLVLLTAGACWDSVDKKKEDQLQLERTVYLAAITPRDSTGTCLLAETQALSCASQAGLTATYMTTMRTVYVISTVTSTPSALCTDLQSSVQYSVHSQAARACHMGCYKEFFARQACTAGTFASTLTVYSGCTPLLITSCTDSLLVTCVNNCMRTGTVIF